MGTRQLHILGSLRHKLHTAQLDAVELACLDCSYEAHDHDDVEKALESVQHDPSSLLMLEPVTLAALIESHSYLPNRQTILCTLERENPCLAQHTEALRSLRYVVGASTPSMMRGTLSAILEYQLTGQSRGLLSRLLQVQSLSCEKHVLTHSSQRSQIQDTVTDFFTQRIAESKETMVSGTSGYPKSMGDVLDEFLMNAIWDANAEREFADRTIAASLGEDETIGVETACDGVNLALSVTDSHGSFPPSAMLKPLKYAMGIKEEAKLNEGPGGAGLGLYLVVQKIAALSYEVERGQMTRAVAVLRGDQSLRDMQKKPRTVLFFDKE